MEKNIFMQLMEQEISAGAGCGEAKAFALAAATLRKYTPGEIKKISAEGSALFVIGVQTVFLPLPEKKRGGLLSMAIGAVGGNADLGMRVFEAVTEADIREAEKLIAENKVFLTLDPEVDVQAPAVYLKMTMETDQHVGTLILKGSYSEVYYLELDGTVLTDHRNDLKKSAKETVDWSGLSIGRIYDYCRTCDIGELEPMKQVIALTREVCRDGLEKDYGAQVGKTLFQYVEKGFLAEDEITHILMNTVAGTDARMSGSGCPTIGNTGSGSQGHIASAAPIAAGEYRGCSEAEIMRATAMANLLNIYMDYKTKEFSHLSPMCYCGTVAAVAGAGGVAYLHHFSDQQMEAFLNSALGILPGVICDGASKPLCALRVYTGLSGALHMMLIAEKGLYIQGFEGLVNDRIEVTLENLYRLQRDCLSHVNEVLFEMKKEQGNII